MAAFKAIAKPARTMILNGKIIFSAVIATFAAVTTPAGSFAGSAPAAEADKPAHPVAMKGDIRVSEVWARAGRRGESAYVFLTVHNDGAVPVLLKGAVSDIATEVRLVRFEMRGPYLRTSRAEPVTVPPNGVLLLEPGVVALQFWKLRRDLRAGQRLGFAVDFLGIGRVDTVADVDSRGAVRYSAHTQPSGAKASH
jgi:copper(I)-binding protein